VTGVRYRLVVRLTAADVGQRVVIRWLLPDPDERGRMTDVLGILEAYDDEGFSVRKRDGQLVVIPRARAVAGKVVPPPPPPRERGR
jgi:hypothetical protein